MLQGIMRFPKSAKSFSLLLACRVGHHNLIRQDEISDPYGFF